MAKKLKALFCLKKRGEIAFYLAVLSFFYVYIYVLKM